MFEHDCVIIPGFGALVGNYMPAHFDRLKSVFQPPSKQIGFNRRLNHNDGLIAGSISREFQIGYVDAKRIVDDFVKELNQKIQKGEVVIFDGIGRFIPDKSRKISFEQDHSSNFFLDSFGLSSFHVQERESKHSMRRAEKRFKDIGIEQKVVKKRKFALMAYIGAPLLAATIILSVSEINNVRDFKVAISSLNPFSAKVESSGNILQITGDNISEPIDNEIAAGMRGMTSKRDALFYEEIKSEIKEKQEVVAVPEVTTEHYIIAGSFKDYVNALKFKNNLEDQGFRAEILDFEDDFYRVSVASFINRDSALSQLYTIRSGKELASVWLLTK